MSRLFAMWLVFVSAMFCGLAGFAAEKSDVAAVYTAQETEQFKKLANETISALDANKKEDAIKKIADLETAWDDQEKTLKPKNTKTWTSIDKTMDKAISAIRSSHEDLAKGKTELQSLIAKLEKATKL